VSRGRDQGAVLRAAVAAHRAGRLREAVAGYHQVLRAAPDQADALHLLGIAHHALGEAAAAREPLLRALVLRPDDPVFRASYGSLLLALGDPAGAERELRAALHRAPRSPEAQGALGLALRALGRMAEAEAALREALAIDPGALATHDNLAALLLEQGRYAEAEPLARQVLAAQRDRPQALNHLALALLHTGRAAEAEAELRRALAAHPGYLATLGNLAATLRALGRWDEAWRCYAALLERRPDDLAALKRATALLLEVGRHDEALALATRAYRAAPDDAAIAQSLIAARRAVGDAAGAEALARAELARAPDARGHAALGSLLRDRGELAAARVELEAALAADPGFVLARTTLAHSRRCASRDDPNLRAMEALAAADATHAEERIVLGYAIGKCHDDLGDADRAFAACATANAARHASRPRYDRAADDARLARCAAAFSAERLRALAASGSSSVQPVFVVGVPRSGTTLVDQIIAAHPLARSAGELQSMKGVAAGLAAPGFPEALLAAPAAARAALAARYLADAERAAGGTALRICDKTPLNFRLLGMIAALFPRARIVHCRRDPLDACLSMYQQGFQGGNEFSNDLDDLAAFYANYQRTMALWREVLPTPLHELRYEELVAAPEDEAQRLIAALGLEWDPRCTHPERAATVVRSASAWQVRQPINTGSVGRWRRYARQLEPLRAALLARGVEVGA